MGVVSQEEAKKSRPQSAAMVGPAGGVSGKNTAEDQVVWQLEMWKRAEMAKFLAHLK